MPKLETNRAAISRRLAREGWLLMRHGSGHGIYRHTEKLGTVIVPRHRTLSVGVARSIAKAAGWL